MLLLATATGGASTWQAAAFPFFSAGFSNLSPQWHVVLESLDGLPCAKQRRGEAKAQRKQGKAKALLMHGYYACHAGAGWLPVNCWNDM